MIEIAIALAVIAFALVAIIGVLPIGMNVQRDNRAETIINHDATYWMEAIRGGARGLDDLTNYIDQITVNGTNFENYYINPGAAPRVFSTGREIIGLLSTPVLGTNGIVAIVRTLSGAATEKNAYKAAPWPGQDVAVRYRLTSRVVPVAPASTLDFKSSIAGAPLIPIEPLDSTLYDIELRFSWPVSGPKSIGTRQKTYRSMASRYLFVDTNSSPVISFFHLSP
jgi:type II secretory pathway pseudopilin PulG